MQLVLVHTCGLLINLETRLVIVVLSSNPFGKFLSFCMPFLKKQMQRLLFLNRCFIVRVVSLWSLLYSCYLLHYPIVPFELFKRSHV